MGCTMLAICPLATVERCLSAATMGTVSMVAIAYRPTAAWWRDAKKNQIVFLQPLGARDDPPSLLRLRTFFQTRSVALIITVVPVGMGDPTPTQGLGERAKSIVIGYGVANSHRCLSTIPR